ncbi:MAG: hypothetical protein ACU841_16890 [Gammaproteobacteria bacterium]
MNPLYKTMSLLLLLLPLSTPGFAETPQQQTPSMDKMKMDQGMGMKMGMGMGMGMQMTEEQMDQHLRSYQEHLLKMHDLSNRILSEQDAAKKQQLKNEQLELMKKHHAQMKEHRTQKMMQHRKKMPQEEKSKSQ